LQIKTIQKFSQSCVFTERGQQSAADQTREKEKENDIYIQAKREESKLLRASFHRSENEQRNVLQKLFDGHDKAKSLAFRRLSAQVLKLLIVTTST